MNTEKRIFITYLFPGAFFPEEYSKQVKSADIPKSIPADCYGFYFMETGYVTDIYGKEFIGESKRIGKTYIIGEVIPVDKIPDMDRGQSTDILKSNIRNNSPTKTAIKTHLGNWQQEDDYHTCLPTSQFKFDDPTIYKNVKK